MSLVALPQTTKAFSSAQVIEIDKALDMGQADQARQLIGALLTPDFAKSDPAQSARLISELSGIAATGEDWRKVHEIATAIAEILMEKLDAEILDNFIFDISVAAGMAGKPEEQDRWLDRGVEIAAIEVDDGSQRALKARVNAAYSQLSTGRAEQALPRMISALKAMEIHGAADLFFNTISQAGNEFYRRSGQDTAATIFDLGLKSTLLDSDNEPGKGFFFFNTAVFLRDIGNFKDATRLHYSALNELSAHFGDDSREVLNAYEGLGQTMHAEGQLPSAEAIYRYIYKKALKALGEDDPALWRIANNHASVLRSLKLPVEALEFDKFAYLKRYHAYGGGNNDTLVSAMNVVHDLLAAYRWQDASDALTTFSRVVAQPGYTKQYRDVVSRWQDYVAYRLEEKILSQDEIETARFLENERMDLEQLLAFLDLYADTAEKMGMFDRALFFRRHAVDKTRQQLGDHHPSTFEALLAYARLRETTDAEGAVIDYRALNVAIFEWMRSNVTSSGSLNGAMAARFLADDMMSAYADFAIRNNEAAKDFAGSLDSWKTMSRRAEQDLRRESENTESTAYRDVIETYLHAYGRLREVVTGQLFGVGDAPLNQAMRDSLRMLNAERHKRGLAVITPWYKLEEKDFPPIIEPASGDVMVDFIVTRTWLADRSGTPQSFRIYAVILCHDAPPQIVLVDNIALGKGMAMDVDSRKNLAGKLTKLLVDVTQDAKALYIIPDDFLFHWQADELHLDDGRHLGETIDVHVATSRQAYEFRDKENHFVQDQPVLLVGGLTDKKMDKPLDLPLSLTEVEEIAALIRENGGSAELLTGDAATEARVGQTVSRMAVLHFATHGFYQGGEEFSAKLFNSGFQLSDADHKQGKQEQVSDNIVYSREVLNWNLRRANLVVVAACETALGDLGVTSTVRGLPLALSVAGTRRSLLTLDKVPDAATAKFMIRFYQHLVKESMTFEQSFIQTKRDAWAGRIENFAPELTTAYILFEH